MATERPAEPACGVDQRGRSLLVVLGALVFSGITHPATAAPKFLGPNKCTSCHDHDKQKQWADKDTHAKALSQLEDKNAGKYAKAIGLADPYDLKGSCVACHATVFNGDANAGVSCETCHGAGSDYVEPHQQKGSHAKSVTLGMIDTRGSYAVWAKMCVDCHILRDTKLIASGHKSGADFDVGSSSQKIVHWAQTYDWAKLSAAGKAAGGKAAGAPAPPKPTPAPAPTSPPAAAPTPAPTKPAPAATRAPITAPPAGAPTTPAPAPPARELPTEVPRVTAPAPEKKASPPPPAEARPTPRPGEISIEIQATPIPSVTPRKAAPGSATGRTVAPPPALQGSPRPAPRVKPRPRRTTAAIQAPAPTRTPTRRPAPQLPPQRAPH